MARFLVVPKLNKTFPSAFVETEHLLDEDTGLTLCRMSVSDTNTAIDCTYEPSSENYSRCETCLEELDKAKAAAS